MTGCNGCDHQWSGLRTAHCSACHLTFTTPANFDKHRRDGRCLDPSGIGLIDAGRNYPCFGQSGDAYRWPDSGSGQDSDALTVQ